ncbi:hypothetical protein EYF80_016596 [Liparis tanakae]|uniref:Uncharacterized protein n=1 Tax=Liparis tanakae TaxID=230148 RepID=A0A4Z2I5L4_9TELE|nr:hypothetical protein EYF80_016596 [Liparis tanakae]
MVPRMKPSYFFSIMSAATRSVEGVNIRPPAPSATIKGSWTTGCDELRLHRIHSLCWTLWETTTTPLLHNDDPNAESNTP